MSEGGAVIMIVEDDEAARVAIATNLRARGHEVDEAGDVREALRLWDFRRPDLILLDLGLPDLDGQAVILRVRREATTPIIVTLFADALERTLRPRALLAALLAVAGAGIVISNTSLVINV